MNIAELIDKHSRELHHYERNRGDRLKQFAIELLEMMKETACNDDLEATIDKALEELRK